MNDKLTKYLAGIIIISASIIAIASSWGDSFIVDEIPHVGSGYSYIARGDYRLNPEHPPLVKDLAAIPLRFLHLNQSAFETPAWQTEVNGQWNFGRHLIFNSGNDAVLITHLAKLPVLIFLILTGFMIFLWTRQLYGNTAGLLALVLFSFSPTVMAHARFVTTDVAAAFGVLWSTYFFITYLKNPTRHNLIFASLIFGIALLTKFSTFLLVPFFIVFAISYSLALHHKLLPTFARTIAVFVIGFVFVVWPVYYLHTYNYPPQRQHDDTTAILRSYGNRSLSASGVIWLSDKPVLRAAGHYGLGLLMVSQRASGGNMIYFLGKVVNSGGPLYFPIVYLIKEPLPWLILITFSLIWLITHIRKPIPTHWFRKYIVKHPEAYAMLLWLTIYWATSIQSSLNIGIRHLLPVYPFMIMLASGQITHISNKLKAISQKRYIAFNFLLIALLGWYLIENLKTFPYYLTYFNETVGGPSGGYRYVTDSNLDWGQDLARLGKWVAKNNIPKIEVDYFGWSDPTYYLGDRYEHLFDTKYLNREDFIIRNTSDGWIAVSATFLQQSGGFTNNPSPISYSWLRAETPLTTIGNSIFIYHLK